MWRNHTKRGSPQKRTTLKYLTNLWQRDSARADKMHRNYRLVACKMLAERTTPNPLPPLPLPPLPPSSPPSLPPSLPPRLPLPPLLPLPPSPPPTSQHIPTDFALASISRRGSGGHRPCRPTDSLALWQQEPPLIRSSCKFIMGLCGVHNGSFIHSRTCQKGLDVRKELVKTSSRIKPGLKFVHQGPNKTHTQTLQDDIREPAFKGLTLHSLHPSFLSRAFGAFPNIFGANTAKPLELSG